MTAPSFNWSAPVAAVSYLSTGLNSLASGSNVLGAAITPSSFSAPNAYALRMDVAIHLASAAFVSTDYMLLWLLESVDGGTTYPDGGSSTNPPAGTPVWTAGVVGTTAAHDLVIPGIVMPAQPFKLLIGNRAGVALASSGNTLSYTYYTPQFPTV